MVVRVVLRYGLLSDVDALTIVLAALGAICVASAVLLILELSDPYTGLFRMRHEGAGDEARKNSAPWMRCRNINGRTIHLFRTERRSRCTMRLSVKSRWRGLGLGRLRVWV